MDLVLTDSPKSVKRNRNGSNVTNGAFGLNDMKDIAKVSEDAIIAGAHKCVFRCPLKFAF